jgi:hypothetical protein
MIVEYLDMTHRIQNLRKRKSLMTYSTYLELSSLTSKGSYRLE